MLHRRDSNAEEAHFSRPTVTTKPFQGENRRGMSSWLADAPAGPQASPQSGPRRGCPGRDFSSRARAGGAGDEREARLRVHRVCRLSAQGSALPTPRPASGPEQGLTSALWSPVTPCDARRPPCDRPVTVYPERASGGSDPAQGWPWSDLGLKTHGQLRTRSGPPWVCAFSREEQVCLRFLHILPSLLPRLPFNDSLVLKGRKSLPGSAARKQAPVSPLLCASMGGGACCGGRSFLQVWAWRLLWLSRSVVSNSLRPQEEQHARFPCPSPFPRVCSWPLHQWGHPTILSSVAPISSSCCESFPASGSFLMSQLFG